MSYAGRRRMEPEGRRALPLPASQGFRR